VAVSGVNAYWNRYQKALPISRYCPDHANDGNCGDGGTPTLAIPTTSVTINEITTTAE
jgi:hypothetical protein